MLFLFLECSSFSLSSRWIWPTCQNPAHSHIFSKEVFTDHTCPSCSFVWIYYRPHHVLSAWFLRVSYRYAQRIIHWSGRDLEDIKWNCIGHWFRLSFCTRPNRPLHSHSGLSKYVTSSEMHPLNTVPKVVISLTPAPSIYLALICFIHSTYHSLEFSYVLFVSSQENASSKRAETLSLLFNFSISSYQNRAWHLGGTQSIFVGWMKSLGSSVKRFFIESRSLAVLWKVDYKEVRLEARGLN